MLVKINLDDNDLKKLGKISSIVLDRTFFYLYTDDKIEKVNRETGEKEEVSLTCARLIQISGEDVYQVTWLDIIANALLFLGEKDGEGAAHFNEFLGLLYSGFVMRDPIDIIDWAWNRLAVEWPEILFLDENNNGSQLQTV